MKKIAVFLQEENGVIAVVAALAMTVILIFCAFVVDLGLAYGKTFEIQNAADASALAAGQCLPVDINDEAAVSHTKETAVLYAEKNGIQGITDEEVTLGDIRNGKYTSVSVDIPCVTELLFAKTFGVNTLSFTRSAKAGAAPAVAVGGAAPLGVDYAQLSEAIERGDTEHIYLKYGAGDGDQGSYGAIDLDGVKGGGANDFSTWLAYGYDGTIKIGDDLLPVEKGNMSGPTASSVNERYNACTHYAGDGGCNCAHYELACPRVLKVLVIEKIGSSYVKVRGFAAFVLEGEAGDKGEVLGSYVKYLEPGDNLEEDAWDTADYGLYNVGLTK